MATPGYSLSISAVDNVSSALAKINSRIAASQMAVSNRVQASIAPWQKLGATAARTTKLLGFDKAAAGIGKVSKGFQEIARGSLDAFRNVARIVEPLAAITGALTLAGMYKLISAWSDFGTKLQFSATRIGIGVSQLQGLQGAAQLAGVSAGALTSGLQGLGQTLYDAAGGRNAAAVGMFQQLGISWRDGAGHAKSVAAVLPQVADAIKGLKDPYAQAQVAAQLFGGASEELLPFLRLGSKGIAEYNAMALKYGIMNQKGAAAANEFRMAQVKVELAVRGLTYSITEKLAPVLVPLLTSMADWVGKNREWIATKIGYYVGEFATWLKSIDWKALGAGVDSFWTKTKNVANALGGWKDVAIGVLAFVGVTFVAGMLAPLVLITAAVLRVAAAFLAIGVNATKGAGIAGVAMRTLLLGLVADKIVNTLDPTDRTGTYIDQTSRAAAAFDDFMARTTGFGRTYAQQDAAAGLEPGTSASGNVTQSAGGGRASTGPLETSVFPRNNPTNLMAYPGQNYATGADGRFATYRTVADGLAGGLHQMLIDQDRGFNSVAKEITRRSPPNENDTAGMIKTIAGWMKTDPNATYDLRDRAQAAAFLRADVRRETGHTPSEADIQTALNEELGPEKKVAQFPLTPLAVKLGFGGGPARSPSSMGVQMPQAGPDITLPSSTNAALASLRGDQAAGKLDVNLKIQHDGTVKATTSTSGHGVGKLRVDTPMQAHAA